MKHGNLLWMEDAAARAVKSPREKAADAYRRLFNRSMDDDLRGAAAETAGDACWILMNETKVVYLAGEKADALFAPANGAGAGKSPPSPLRAALSSLAASSASLQRFLLLRLPWSFA